VFGLDEALSGLAAGHGLGVALALAFVLGLRHASDPDHLVAVSTLVAGTREAAGRAGARLGAAWGAGHATTMVGFGLPTILLQAYLPGSVERLAEALIGAVIAALAVRLLLRWRRGAFHFHSHEHEGSHHRHVHSHSATSDHAHVHPVRSPRQAFLIGLLHGMAGSGGVAVLLVAAVPDRTVAVAALAILALGTAVSMTLLSGAVGRVLGGVRARRSLARAIPALGAAAVAFGVWYTAAALSALSF
jgi:ABC-type nickel/cobalt efflux system permease component RcnA